MPPPHCGRVRGGSRRMTGLRLENLLLISLDLIFGPEILVEWFDRLREAGFVFHKLGDRHRVTAQSCCQLHGVNPATIIELGGLHCLSSPRSAYPRVRMA